MYLGRIVEIGPAEEIFADPQHPYTQALLRAIPEPDPARGVPRDLPRGEIPDAARPPLGCSFHPRCPEAFGRCGWEARDLRTLLEQRWLELAPEASAREKALFADLEALAADGLSTVAIAPGRGHTPEDVLEYLRHLREEATEPNRVNRSGAVWSRCMPKTAGPWWSSPHRVTRA